MSKFNQSTLNTNKITNHCDAVAYKMQDKEKLMTMVLTSFFGEDKFYGDNSAEMVELAKSLIQKGQAQFVSNLAIYARKEMHLRSVSHVLGAILANEEKGKPFVKATLRKIIERVDDITEILSYYLSTYGKPIPNSLKKALAEAMNGFNEYQFAKYAGNNKSVKVRDVLRLVHPVAQDSEHSEIFKSIIDGTLKTPYTWETELSTKGNNTETWEQLIDSGKVGYMATLRNLNNILNARPSNIEKVYDLLSNEENVLKSKQLPFRFLSAYTAIKDNEFCTSRILDTLETAIKHSVKNLEKIKGRTLIAIDVSGSMCNTLSRRSDTQCADISRLIGAMANYLCEESLVLKFDDQLYSCTMPTSNGIISNALAISVDGGGTNIALPLNYILEHNLEFDRMILLSDNEINSQFAGRGWKALCQSLVAKYRKEINKNFWVHAIDLLGYGTQQFAGEKTNIIAGWSEGILGFINIVESGLGDLITTIEEYGLV